MLKSLFVVSGLLLAVIFLSFSEQQNTIKITPDTFLSDVLHAFGEKKPIHFIENRRDTSLIRRGKEIIFTGQTTDAAGKKTKIQSKHFMCTHCHTTVKEDPNPAVADPEARLDYCAENNIPFLPGSTLYGIVNREAWYNGDYLEKYGDLVKPARDTLRNAIHLCATECSQGRALEKWEMEAVIAYLYAIEYRLGDLNLTTEEYEKINLALTEKNTAEIRQWLKSKYYQTSPATFSSPIARHERLLGKNGNPENGKKIYTLSCMHCHKEGGVTNFKLNDEKLTFRFLKRQMKTKYHFSIYEITRTGTYALNGYKPYMPNYTLERMSPQQLEDLAAYINQQAKR